MMTTPIKPKNQKKKSKTVGAAQNLSDADSPEIQAIQAKLAQMVNEFTKSAKKMAEENGVDAQVYVRIDVSPISKTKEG